MSGAAEQTPSKRGRIRGVARSVLGVVAVTLLGFAIYSERTSLAHSLSDLGPGRIALAFAVSLCALGASMMSWRGAMAAVAGDMPVGLAARVFFVSQLGKYMPGSVWPLLAQVELARDRGVSRARGATAAILAMLVGVVTSALVACTGLVFSTPETLSTYRWALLVLPIGGLVLIPAVLRRVLTIGLRLARNGDAAPAVSGRGVWRSVAWSLCMWMLFGLHAWILSAHHITGSGSGFTLVTGAFALAWLVGFLAVLAPAGLGVREGAFVLALGGTFARPDALALALASRLVLTLADAVSAGLAVFLTRHRIRTPPPEDSAPA